MLNILRKRISKKRKGRIRGPESIIFTFLGKDMMLEIILNSTKNHYTLPSYSSALFPKFK